MKRLPWDEIHTCPDKSSWISSITHTLLVSDANCGFFSSNCGGLIRALLHLSESCLWIKAEDLLHRSRAFHCDRNPSSFYTFVFKKTENEMFLRQIKTVCVHFSSKYPAADNVAKTHGLRISKTIWTLNHINCLKICKAGGGEMGEIWDGRISKSISWVSQRLDKKPSWELLNV